MTTASQRGAPDVSVVLVSWNTRELLRACLRSLREHTRGCGYEVIVVDNASSDGTPAVLRAEHPDVQLLENERNAGFAVAANRGIGAALGRYVLLLNSDTRLVGDTVTALVQILDAHPDAGAAGCALYHEDGVPQPSCGRFPSAWHRALVPLHVAALWRMVRDPRQHFVHPFLSRGAHAREREVDWLIGACFMVRRAAIAQVGLLDERLFLFAEDWDLCYRLRAAGWRVRYTPATRVVHVGAASWTESDARRRRAVLQSALYFHRKHFGAASAAWFKLSTALSASLKSLFWCAAYAAYPGGRARTSMRLATAVDAMAWGFGRRG